MILLLPHLGSIQIASLTCSTTWHTWDTRQRRHRERQRDRESDGWSVGEREREADRQLELQNTKAVAAFVFNAFLCKFPCTVQQTDDNHKRSLPPPFLLWPPSKWTDICQHNRDIYISKRKREGEREGARDRQLFMRKQKRRARVCFSCILHEKLGRARATHTHTSTIDTHSHNRQTHTHTQSHVQ